MINYVVYSNTDYLDILRVATDYLQGKGKLTLLINSNSRFLEDIYEKYDTVIHYNDKDPYGKRLLTCFNQINDEYVLFLHENDIVLNTDDSMLKKFLTFLDFYSYDRIDLQHTFNLRTSSIIDIKDWSTKYIDQITDSVYLIKSEDVNDYIYNVNPSIWRVESFIKLLTEYQDSTYRDIEFVAQKFCSQFNVYKLFSRNFIQCGYFRCLELFKFLHITHHGKLLNPSSEFLTDLGHSYKAVADEYLKMYEKYNLKDAKLTHFNK